MASKGRNSDETVRAEDVISVGSRVSWGAILAGGMVALALHVLLSLLGAAVGLTISDRVAASDLATGALVWSIVSICVSLFVGGLVVSQCTVGENKMEAVLYGIVMWAFLFTVMTAFAVAGAQAGMTSMLGLAQVAQNAPRGDWERAAREAGIPANQIEEWRKQAASTVAQAAKDLQTPQRQQEISEAATRVTWYAFLGTWLSMMAAALGGWLGAGPTFRLIAFGTAEPTATAGAIR